MKWVVLFALGLALVALDLSGAVSRNQLALKLVNNRDLSWNQLQFTMTSGAAPARPCAYLLRVASYFQIEPPSPENSRYCDTIVLAELWDARQLWLEGKPEEACDIWWKLNAATDVWAAVQASSAKQDWNGLQASLQCLDRWRDVTPDAPTINTIYTGWVAEEYVHLAEHEQAEGNPASALAAADRAYVWLPVKTNGNITLLKARLLMEQQGIDAAEEWLMSTASAADDPSYLYTVWLNWADYLASNNETDRAIAGYQRAIRAAPQHGSYAYERLASNYLNQERLPHALDALNAGLAAISSEQQTPLFVLLGQTHERAHDPHAAYCAYQAALQNATDKHFSAALVATERSTALVGILPSPISCD